MLRCALLIYFLPIFNSVSAQQKNFRYTKTLNDSVFVIGDIILVTCIDYNFGSANPNSEDSIKKLITFFVINIRKILIAFQISRLTR